jgi:hypothetical protein
MERPAERVMKAARICQADIERTIRAARKAAPGSRIIVDLARQRVEIDLTGGADSASESDPNPWDEDDATP